MFEDKRDGGGHADDGGEDTQAVLTEDETKSGEDRRRHKAGKRQRRDTDGERGR